MTRVANSNDRAFFLNDRICSYSKFVNFLQVSLAIGLFAETVPCAANATTPGCSAAKPSGGSGSTASSELYGRICFDPARAQSTLRSTAENLNPLCGSMPLAKPSPVTLTYAVLGRVQPEFVLRSPAGVFSYLGKLLHNGTADRISYYTGEAKQLGRFLDIATDGTTGTCYVSVSYEGRDYCVPQEAYNTALMLDILEELRNLSISPSDLTESFTVRVSD